MMGVRGEGILNMSSEALVSKGILGDVVRDGRAAVLRALSNGWYGGELLTSRALSGALGTGLYGGWGSLA
jgi:hypothetical protein